MSRVCCVGHVNWDVTLRLDALPDPDAEAVVRETSQTGGGSAANVAVGLAGLDCAVTLVGSVGDDEHGLLARRDLDRAGVDLSRLRTVDGETTTKYLLVDDTGEVSVLATPGVNEALGPHDIDPEPIRAADHVHVTAHRPDTVARVADIATDAGVPLSIDPGRRVESREYGPVLEAADLLFVNDREADCLDAPTPPVVVRKCGTDGAVVETPESRYVHDGYRPPAVDTTGAGDAFAAGYIASRLRDRDHPEALATANAAGALATESKGPKTDLGWERLDAIQTGERE
ncbi:carbohydrate kinase family protein [Halosegnis rubeus]|jgi:ribokinase|uniref:Carbohydrate kinase family protein n=1 Tax=Halosegnis rubeus TaxID=2212850 RepID=A0A5N5UE77_9EURY|nr:PfkB family carbohydrate kinase [Halosegnis rubeus]KAB7515732.1 carbohydrate kinase family protein [Halosegnis rubeus]KAB7517053.1 carbohydrate kinase family protein [Halosegnis rubeus]KAB7519819.1 carbohydrate kinase family protein [Halosegnis rubeus]